MIYSTIAYYALKALIFSSIGLLALLVVRRAPASTRHAVALAFLCGLIVLPIIGFFSHHVAINAPETVARSYHYIVEPKLAVFETAGSMTPLARDEAYSKADYLTTLLAYTYLAVFGFLLLKLGLALGHAKRLAKAVKPFGRGAVLSDRVIVPMTVWAWRPTILLPTEAVAWESERVSRVLAHEGAHIFRKDLVWNLLGQIVCAVYWPVPTVWALQKIARNASERACDDVVLASGVTAPDYAQDLLEVARSVSRVVPSVALPIADKTEVGKRIAHVLDRKTRRGAVTVALVCATSAIALSGSISVAIFGIGYVPNGERLSFATRSQAPSPTGWASPGSISGTADNGFVGTLPDGRRVEFMQIQRFNGRGFEAWKPDGTPIDNPTIYGGKHWMTKPQRLEMILRFQSSSKAPDVNAGLGSGPYSPGDPDTQEFAGGGTLRPIESGWRTSVDFIEIGGAMSQSGYTFGIADAPPTPLTTIRPNADGTVKVESSRISDAKFVAAEPILQPKRKENGAAILDKDGHGINETIQACTLELTLANGSREDLQEIAYDKSGKAYDGMNWGTVNVDGGNFHCKRYFPFTGDKLDRIELSTSQSLAVEFLDVKLSPKTVAP